jgi:hypothetical protein
MAMENQNGTAMNAMTNRVTIAPASAHLAMPAGSPSPKLPAARATTRGAPPRMSASGIRKAISTRQRHGDTLIPMERVAGAAWLPRWHVDVYRFLFPISTPARAQSWLEVKRTAQTYPWVVAAAILVSTLHVFRLAGVRTYTRGKEPTC